MCRVRRTRILLHLHIQLEGTVLRGKNVLKYYHALSRTTHDAMLHSALWCCATGLERIQHSVHSKSLALKCTEHSVLSK